MRASDKEVAPQVRTHPGTRPTHLRRIVDTTRIPHDDHDDTVEAHYASLEHPHACLNGLVFVGYIDEYGEEREASYPCRRCLETSA
jgi:hypothetical protein